MPDPEYIVVGSGAGGGPLAARLAELGHTVLLLEAGGDEAPWTYQVPVFHGLATEDEAMRLDHYVHHYEDDQRQKRDPKFEPDRGGVYYPRARTLGGCTAHYAMIIVRPHDSDWEAIRQATGDASWAPTEMNKYFAKVERCLYRDGTAGGHGSAGWLPTRFPDVIDLATEVIRHKDTSIARIVAGAAKTEASRLRPKLSKSPTHSDFLAAKVDPNDIGVLEGHDAGLIAIPMAIDQQGRRAGARERIKAAVATGRLEIRMRSHVTELLFDPADPRRVTGVRFLPGERLYRAERDPARFGQPTGPAQDVRASREVILSAGAFITPQLLMLSGIGDTAALEQVGIASRVHLPGVGANLQDRYEVGVVAKSNETFDLLAEATFTGPSPESAPGDPLFEQWRKGRGLYATNGAVIGFTAKSSMAEHGEPDLFLFGVPGAFTGYKTDWSAEAVAPPRDKWTWLLLKAHARFRGRVKLKSKDPLEPPAVDFNYFALDAAGALSEGAKRDLTAMREGVKIVNKLIAGSNMLTLHPEIMQGVHLETDAGIDQFVQDRAWGHHASCTCKIGGEGDTMAVLDSSFRVRGVQNLRVVDASVFPKIPGFFVVMPTYMISEKAADVIHAG